MWDLARGIQFIRSVKEDVYEIGSQDCKSGQIRLAVTSLTMTTKLSQLRMEITRARARPAMTDCLFPPRFHPALEIDQRQRALVLGRLLEGAVVELADPDLVGGAGAVLGEREPHQPARRLTRNIVAGKQHGAEHGLRRTLPLLRRQAEPARRLARIVWGADAVEIEPR